MWDFFTSLVLILVLITISAFVAQKIDPTVNILIWLIPAIATLIIDSSKYYLSEKWSEPDVSILVDAATDKYQLTISSNGNLTSLAMVHSGHMGNSLFRRHR